MRSAWVCSLNDVAGNAAVLVASAVVALTGSGWPDIIVGLLIAAMFGASAVRVIRSAGWAAPTHDDVLDPSITSTDRGL